jgi:hypothetical protein
MWSTDFLYRNCADGVCSDFNRRRFQRSFQNPDVQPPRNCLPCHQRQFDELRSSVKSGYRNVSPLFNGLEAADNLINGGLLRPVYHDSPVVLPDGVNFNTNMLSTPVLTEARQLEAGFCYTCHNADVEKLGHSQPQYREIPQLAALQSSFRPDLFRPVRDYHMVDSGGNQMLPATIGGQPPPGAQPSLGSAGVTCYVCDNVAGPDPDRSFHRDGFGNIASFPICRSRRSARSCFRST